MSRVVSRVVSRAGDSVGRVFLVMRRRVAYHTKWRRSLELGIFTNFERNLNKLYKFLPKFFTIIVYYRCQTLIYGTLEMPRYGMATYKSRKQSNDIAVQQEFDLALATRNDGDKTGNGRKNDSGGTRKPEQKTKTIDEQTENHKKRKRNPLLEDELFGFLGSDSELACTSSSDVPVKNTKSPSKTKSPSRTRSPVKISSQSSSNSPFKLRSPFKNCSPSKSSLKVTQGGAKSPLKGVKKTVKFDETDKSTDDEAYGSSQEPGTSSQERECTEDCKPEEKQVLYVSINTCETVCVLSTRHSC